MRKLVVGVLLLLALTIAGLLVLPGFVDWNRHRDTIQATAGQLIGRDIEIAGDIGFRLLPEPRLALADLTLARRDGIAARIAAVHAEVDLLPLFLGRIEVRRLTVIRPEVELQLGDAVAAARGRLQTLVPGTAFEAIDVEAGSLDIVDAADGGRWTITDIRGRGAARSLRGPFSARGRAVWGGREIDFNVGIGRLRDDGVVVIPQFRAEVDRAGAKLVFAGTYRRVDGVPSLRGALDLEARDPAGLVASLGGVEDAPLPEGVVQLSGRLRARGREVALNDMKLSVAGARMSGALAAVIGPTVQFDLTLEANRIDLDALDGTVAWDVGTALGLISGTRAWAPPWLWGRIDLDLGGLTWGGGVLRQSRVSARLFEGGVRLDGIDSTLPGDSRLTFADARSSSDGGGARGRVTLVSSNPTRLFHWLGLDMSGLPPDWLADLGLVAEVGIDGDLLQLSALEARFDESRLTGVATYRVQQRPVFGAELALNRLDLDSYAALGAGDVDLDAWRRRLAALTRFDANLQLAIEALRLGGQDMERVEFDAGLSEGRLTVRRAGIGVLAGASVAFTATAGAFADAPRLKTRFRLASDDPSRLAQALSLPRAALAKRLGRARIEGELAVDFEQLTFEAEAGLAALRLAADGRWSHGEERRPFTLDVQAEVLDADALASSFELDVPLPTAPNDLKMKLTGDDGGLALDAALRSGGGSATLAGYLRGDLRDPEMALKFSARHPEPAALFAPWLGERARDLAVAVDLAGRRSELALRDLSLHLDERRITGGGRLILGGARPMVELDLQANELSVAGEGGFPPLGADGLPWPSAALGLARLPSIDGRVALAVERLGLGMLEIENAALSLRARPGLLRLEGFKGRLLGGELSLAGRLLAGRSTGATAKFNLRDADFAALLGWAGAPAGPAGRITIAGALDGVGPSPRALIEGLSGALTMEITEGTLSGLALADLRSRLADGALTIEALAAGLAGSTVPFRLDGQWNVADGVARTADGAGTIQGLPASLRGEIDLAAWRLDLDLRAALSGIGTEVPDLVVRIEGPIRRAARRDNLERLARAVARRARAAR